MDIPQGPMLLKGMEKIANRVLTGLVLAGLLVASGLLLPYFRVPGLAGFLVAGAIALYVVISILVSDRRSARKTRQ